MEYDWVLGRTYSLCMTARPADGATLHSGFFSDGGDWVHLATFRMKHQNDGHHLRRLGSFVEDWLSDGKNGGYRRECLFGPALVRLSGADGLVGCTSCRGISQDTRLPAGYLNRHVYRDGQCIGVAIGGDGEHAHGTDLFCGPLTDCRCEAASLKLNGAGSHAGLYTATCRILNGQPVFTCSAKRTFIGSSGIEWHIAPLDYLDEIVTKQGPFGSLDHSTNGNVDIFSSTWDEYTDVSHL